MSDTAIGITLVALATVLLATTSPAQGHAPLPAGAKAVWDIGKAHRERTPTRERICINGLWLWQPATPASEQVPGDNWGYFKVPGSWPEITNYMHKDSQTVHRHPNWENTSLASLTASWHQRDITIPASWSGRRIALQADYVNSFAAIYVDGRKAGELSFPGGEVELTSLCRPGRTHALSILVVALPLKGVLQSYNDSNSARSVKGSVERRGLCGDVYLEATPAGPRITEVKIDTSVRKSSITLGVALANLDKSSRYTLSAHVTDGGQTVKEFTSKAFAAADLAEGRFAFSTRWLPEKLWDTHTPQNQYDLAVTLASADKKELDSALPIRFGFREFWIEGRDFYLNGSRIYLCAVPFDNAQVGAALANYEAAVESIKRLQSFGINAVYTHNYNCLPGSHLGFEEILRAADDTGMLISFSQPHMGHYEWDDDDADLNNGYARHAAFYVRVAQNHASAVMYSMNHNATGYAEDMNPDRIDGISEARSEWSVANARRALRAEAIVKSIDPTRVIYHHSSGNLGSMHTSNFYPNWVPIQEMSDWFEHWATKGVKPVFTCEYGAPFMWDWAMYRGWYRGGRNFGSATVPWDFSLAEWNSQFLGDAAFAISDEEKENLRWEAEQFRIGRVWHRWDYPHVLGSRDFDERYPVHKMYIDDNWRAFRTWGVSATSPWGHATYWKMRPGLASKQLTPIKTDWENLQRPGFSPDFQEDRYERFDLAYEREDWVPTLAADALCRNNAPLLAYIAGKSGKFTSKDHNFLAGETVEKQIIVLNNSREPVTAEWTCSLGSTPGQPGKARIETGQQHRAPIRFKLPADSKPGTYTLSATITFSTGETQKDAFALHVMPAPTPTGALAPRIAIFDPKGETADLLAARKVRATKVDASADLSAFDILIIGKAALKIDAAAPNLAAVRNGLKVLVFEQTGEALEKLLGFRVEKYGLRNVFPRLSDHPVLAGLTTDNLRDWRGASTLLAPRLKYTPSETYNGVPTDRWCGLEVPRLWRCGNQGSVASVLIEKPAAGDFLPIIDGGFSQQYSPLMEYREGKGMVLFCQLNVTGRTETEPAAERLVGNLLEYTSAWTPTPTRQVVYAGGPEGRKHLQHVGIQAADFDARRPLGDSVLVVGPGGARQLQPYSDAITKWTQAGGHMLMLEVDGTSASALLPEPVTTKPAEHIAATFDLQGKESLFAGVAPADVHNRDPRELNLVTGGADALGDGVLAKARGVNAVMCQLAPYSFVNRPLDAPGFTIDAEDAAEGKQSALITMGTVSWAQFGQGVKAGDIGKTYTIAAFVKSLGEPGRARLEIERAARPWDRAAKGDDIKLPADEWTELHLTFKVTKRYPENWAAYLHCGHPGARLRADGFRLYEGEYTPMPREALASIPNAFKSPGFEDGSTKPWFFTWRTEQHNLKRTYRRSTFLVSRLLGNMGVRAQTPLLTRMSTPTSGPPQPSIIKNGDFAIDADYSGIPDRWQITDGSKGKAICKLEPIEPGSTRKCLRMVNPKEGGTKQTSLMLSQPDVPIQEGQWYVLSLKAKAEGLNGRVAVACSDTSVWKSLIAYQYFKPTGKWQTFTFLVQGQATATSPTRFQIWHSLPGTLLLADVSLAPCASPSEGRWMSGLYADNAQEWDSPYRFFRW